MNDKAISLYERVKDFGTGKTKKPSSGTFFTGNEFCQIVCLYIVNKLISITNSKVFKTANETLNRYYFLHLLLRNKPIQELTNDSNDDHKYRKLIGDASSFIESINAFIPETRILNKEVLDFFYPKENILSGKSSAFICYRLYEEENILTKTSLYTTPPKPNPPLNFLRFKSFGKTDKSLKLSDGFVLSLPYGVYFLGDLGRNFWANNQKNEDRGQGLKFMYFPDQAPEDPSPRMDGIVVSNNLGEKEIIADHICIMKDKKNANESNLIFDSISINLRDEKDQLNSQDQEAIKVLRKLKRKSDTLCISHR